jgi:two-component system response regulator HydG
MTLAPEVVSAFLNYQWPGNIRELQNVIEGAVQLTSGSEITFDIVSEYLISSDLDSNKHPIGPSESINSTLSENEKQLLLDNLAKYKFNKSEVAKAMNMSRKTLYRRLKEYGIW